MSVTPSGAATKPSNRLSHGLTSRSRAEGWRKEAEKLALDLIGDATRTPAIMEAAQALARDIILVAATRQEKWSVFSGTGAGSRLRSGSGDGVAEAGAGIRNQHQPSAGLTGITAVEMLLLASRSLRRLDELKRKATSRRNRLMTRLDFLIIEELRKRPSRS